MEILISKRRFLRNTAFHKVARNYSIYWNMSKVCQCTYDFKIRNFRIISYTLEQFNLSEQNWGVSSVPFSFRFPFQLHCELFRNQFTISSKYFDMACYLKQEAYSGPVSFVVQQTDVWTDNIQSFEMPF